MSFENPTNQEVPKITPEKELEYTMDAVKDGDWGEAGNCLSEFISKVSDNGILDEDKEKFKSKLEEIKNAFSEVAEDILKTQENTPEGEKYVSKNIKEMFAVWIKRAEEKLEA